MKEVATNTSSSSKDRLSLRNHRVDVFKATCSSDKITSNFPTLLLFMQKGLFLYSLTPCVKKKNNTNNKIKLLEKDNKKIKQVCNLSTPAMLSGTT